MKRGTPNHPKVFELAKMLSISRPTAIGLLELLWHFTAQYAPAGDIGRYSDDRIAASMDWRRKPEVLVRALVATGWLDPSEGSRLVVHDWSDHADNSVRKRLARNGLMFAIANPITCSENDRKVSDDDWDVTGKCPAVSRLPLPEPEPRPEPSANGGAPFLMNDFDGEAWGKALGALWLKAKQKQLGIRYLLDSVAAGSDPEVIEKGVRAWAEHWHQVSWQYCDQSLPEFAIDRTWEQTPPPIKSRFEVGSPAGGSGAVSGINRIPEESEDARRAREASIRERLRQADSNGRTA